MVKKDKLALRIFGLFFILVIIVSWFIGTRKGRAVLKPYLEKGGQDLKAFELKTSP